DKSKEELSWSSTDDEGKDGDDDEEDEGDDGEQGDGDDDDEDDDGEEGNGDEDLGLNIGGEEGYIEEEEEDELTETSTLTKERDYKRLKKLTTRM
nr:hypothetical protein [Tanacetum cinerariifolium]